MRFVFVLLAMLMMTGCSSSLEVSEYGERMDNGSVELVEPLDPSMDKETEQPAGAVVMTTELPEYPVGTNEITLLFSTDVKSAFITYGEYWYAEVLENGKWYRIPFKPDETIHDIAYILGEQWEYYNGSASMTHELSRLDYDFHPGRYRILKEFGGVMYAAEFEMVED
ncbi:MAG: hypothetical protein IKV57_06110 [Clostridia bacterium]|nr:hypothetical protein [Clostridia bacterium]